MNKQLAKKSKEEEEGKCEGGSENLEKTKQLMNYAQKHQQAKESYKPGKLV